MKTKLKQTRKDYGRLLSGSLWCDGGYYRLAIERLNRLEEQQLTSTYDTPLFRMHEITNPYNYNKCYSTAYTQDCRKLPKEVTRQANSKYSLCKISEKFCQEFLTFFTNRIHDFSITYRRTLSSVTEN